MPAHKLTPIALATIMLAACQSDDAPANSQGNSTPTPTIDATSMDIENHIFSQTSGDCGDHANVIYDADVQDITRSLGFNADVAISASGTTCAFSSNNIPNHDFNDATAHFATNVSAVTKSYSIVRNPSLAASSTALSHSTVNGIMLNGVILDILSAGCYNPSSPQADKDGNVAVGCSSTDPYLMDPLGSDHKFGADQHNAHTQPDGSYHYHGNPNALFDDNPGPSGSPVIGFAADGFPIYGSYFKDELGQVRKAVSGYELKSGSRSSASGYPGGSFDGTYTSDYQFTGNGDLDACNGMTVNGQYGYYVTDSYPWVMACFSGTPHSSFNKF